MTRTIFPGLTVQKTDVAALKFLVIRLFPSHYVGFAFDPFYGGQEMESCFFYLCTVDGKRASVEFFYWRSLHYWIRSLPGLLNALADWINRKAQGT